MPEKINLKIDWASKDAVKYACQNWHYSKTVPCGKIVKVGVWEDNKFIGVVLFSRGANPYLFNSFNLTQDKGCELTRIALDKHKSNVSQIMSLAIRKLKSLCPDLELIISFADADQEHLGIIYQATNWIYSGLSNKNKKGTAYIINNKKVHSKTANERVRSRNLRGTLDNIKRVYNTENVRHHITKGKHKYLMPLNKTMRNKVILLSKPYPKATTLAEI